MKRLLVNFAAIVSIIGLFPVISSAQLSYIREVKDSVTLGQYTAITYDVIGPDKKVDHEEFLLRLGRAPAMSTMCKTVWLYDFAKDTPGSKGPVYSKDINHNGIDEIIVFGNTGLGNCCSHASIHALEDKIARDVGQLDIKYSNDFSFKDLDKDSIPEIIFKDPTFGEWKAPLEKSPMPLTIWEWHDGRYRLANYRFSDYLLKEITKADLKKLDKQMKQWAEKDYKADPELYKNPPVKLWEVMLDYIYAGKYDTADSLFKAKWPEQIPGQKEFNGEFQRQLRSGEYWQDLEKSDF